MSQQKSYLYCGFHTEQSIAELCPAEDDGEHRPGHGWIA